MTHAKTPLALALAAVLALGGCGGASDDGAATEDTTDVALEAPGDEGYDGGGDFNGEATGQDDADEAAPALTAATIEGLERALAHENEGLQAALDELAKADTDASKLMALGQLDLEAIEAGAADAADIPAEDYARLKESLFDVLGKIEMHDMVTAQFAGMDTAELDEETRAQVEKGREEMMAGLEDPFAGLDEDAVAAFKARQARLAELRAQHIGLMFKFLGA